MLTQQYCSIPLLLPPSLPPLSPSCSRFLFYNQMDVRRTAVFASTSCVRIIAVVCVCVCGHIACAHTHTHTHFHHQALKQTQTDTNRHKQKQTEAVSSCGGCHSYQQGAPPFVPRDLEDDGDGRDGRPPSCWREAALPGSGEEPGAASAAVVGPSKVQPGSPALICQEGDGGDAAGRREEKRPRCLETSRHPLDLSRTKLVW